MLAFGDGDEDPELFERHGDPRLTSSLDYIPKND
jgi:hypothetical protein